MKKGVTKGGGNRKKENRELTGRERRMKKAEENLAMTAATREQHAKLRESFPASSKTFMEF